MSTQPPPGYSRAGIPASATGSVLAFLCQRFPHIGQETWLQRLEQGQVLSQTGHTLHANSSLAGITHVLYQREVPNEQPIPFQPRILFQDAHLLVVDKPHFLPVTPSGQYVQQTVLRKLQATTGLPDIAPLHRLDRETAGVLLLSHNPHSRNAYHHLFRTRAIRKIYQAIAPADARFQTPYLHQSRLIDDKEKFFRMQQAPGAPNSATQITLLQQRHTNGQHWGLYQLEPITGKRHQLRVHMAALGIPICNDRFYPTVNDAPPGDYTRPLQLLASELHFTDPLTQQPRNFHSQQKLQWPQ